METRIRSIVEGALRAAFACVGKIVSGGEVIHGDGESFGSLTADTELRADKELGETLLDALLAQREIRSVTVEGFGTKDRGRGSLRAYVDPLDASLHYRFRYGSSGFPFTSVVTILPASVDQPTFADVQACGVIDLRNGDCWSAVKGCGTVLNGRVAKTADIREINPGKHPFGVQNYYAEFRKHNQKVFEGLSGYVWSPGSAAYEMASVSNGMFAAYFTGRQKHHELGAGYLLVTEAGGCVMTMDGKPLAAECFNFNTTTEGVVLAGSEELAREIMRRWNS